MLTATARTTDPLSSFEAADTVPVNELEAVCLRWLRQCPEGLTSRAIADLSGMELVSISPRLKPLEDRGLIYRDGKRAYRSRVACVACVVWKAVPESRKQQGELPL